MRLGPPRARGTAHVQHRVRRRPTGGLLPCQGFLTHLVLRCGEGDEAALGELFDLTYFLVAGVVNPGHLSSTGADDRVVDAFRRIWQRSGGYEPTEQGVLSWVFDQAVERAAGGDPSTPEDRQRRRRDADQAVGRLSNREVSVLELVSRGLSNQDIAAELYVSINTVKTYIRSAYRKIGVTRRAQAVLWAVHHDLGPPRRHQVTVV